MLNSFSCFVNPAPFLKIKSLSKDNKRHYLDYSSYSQYTKNPIKMCGVANFRAALEPNIFRSDRAESLRPFFKAAPAVLVISPKSV